MSFLEIYVIIASIMYGVIMFVSTEPGEKLDLDTVLGPTVLYIVVTVIVYFLLLFLMYVHIIDFLLKHSFIIVSFFIVSLSIVLTAFKKEAIQFFKDVLKL